MPLWILLLIILTLSIAAVFMNSLLGKDAPYVAMEPEVVKKVLKLAGIKKGDMFYDLGSGDGRLVIAAAQMGVKKSVGIEIEKFKAKLSQRKIKKMGLKNAQIINDDLYNIDLSDATVVSVYLLPRTFPRLKKKLKSELKKGTKVVSSGFSIKGWKPARIEPKGTRYGPLYLYER